MTEVKKISVQVMFVVIKAFKTKYKIQKIVIIADSIKRINYKGLLLNTICFIVSKCSS